MYFKELKIDERAYSTGPFDYYYKHADYPGEGKGKIGVFDIETTGLDWRSCKVVIGGVLEPTDEGLIIKQYFSEDESDEINLLEAYVEELSKYDVLVSFNGDRFDVPFVNTRLNAHSMGESFKAVTSLDMYRVLNKFSTLREVLPNLKQKTVEAYMGLDVDRADQIDGAQSVELYYRYLYEPREKLRDIMLLHNSDDVAQLSRILWMFDKLDIHKIAANTGFPVISNKKKMYIRNMKMQNKKLKVSGNTEGIDGEYEIYRTDANVRIADKEFSVEIPLRYEEKVSYFHSDDCEIVGDDLWTHPSVRSDIAVIRDGKDLKYDVINRTVKSLLEDILIKL